MHRKVKDFLKKHKELVKGEVLDVGSLNVNGQARDSVPVTVGVDMREGRGVDLVCKGEDLLQHFPEEHFDVVITTDTLEHVENWRDFLLGMWSVLKKDGVFIGTIASKTKGRHAYPDDYWRLEKHHLENIFGELDDFEELGASTGWVKTKKRPLLNLKDVHLDPVDKKVPEDLLGPDRYNNVPVKRPKKKKKRA